jgi:hypothetical protein
MWIGLLEIALLQLQEQVQGVWDKKSITMIRSVEMADQKIRL